jgi:hypothetical protein
MEIVALFKDFGYPALISAVLLWILFTKLEKLVLFSQHMTDLVTEIKLCVEKNNELMLEIRGLQKKQEAENDNRRDSRTGS